MTGKKKKRLIVGLLMAAVSVLGMTLVFISSRQGTVDCGFSDNAAWISVDWVNEPVSSDAVAHLVKDAQARDIRTLYVYTSYLRRDGTFNPTYSHAQAFVEKMRIANNDIMLLEWIGLPLENESDSGIQGWVNLDDSETRKKIVQFAVETLEENGMDGIHINAETVKNGDEGFLHLLDELNEALGDEVMLSTAGSHWWPDWLVRVPLVKNLRWTSEYYGEVAKRVDQIAVMTYDSHLPNPWLYRWWVSWQVRHINDALDGIDVEILFGVSVSGEATAAHHPDAEGLENGLRGICTVNPNSRAAIYADWEFTTEDRIVWENLNRKMVPAP